MASHDNKTKRRHYNVHELIGLLEQSPELSDDDESIESIESDRFQFQAIGLMIDMPEKLVLEIEVLDKTDAPVTLPVTNVPVPVDIEPVICHQEPDDMPLDDTRDIDYESESDSDKIIETGEKPKRKRNKTAQRDPWKLNMPKVKRLKGAQIRRGIENEARKMGSRCESNFCRKSYLRNCNKFSESIFKSFWEMTSWAERMSIVKPLAVSIDIKQKKKSASNKRATSYRFILRVPNGTILQVCKSMFCSTLGIAERTITDWLSLKVEDGSNDVDDVADKLCKEKTRSGPTQKMSDDTVYYLRHGLSIFRALRLILKEVLLDNYVALAWFPTY